MERTRWKLVGVLLGAVLLSGCATVVNGPRQKIGVSSTPTGAMVMIDNQQQVLTPASVDLARDQSHTLYFHKDGYQDDSFAITSGTSGWVLGNILLGGLIGGVVDFATGSARKLSQDSVHVTLAPLPPGQAAMPTIQPAGATFPARAPSASPPAGSATPLSSTDVELRALLAEYNAGRMPLDEYRARKRMILNQEPVSSTEERLQELGDLRNKGLLTQPEYERKRAEIVKGL